MFIHSARIFSSVFGPGSISQVSGWRSCQSIGLTYFILHRWAYFAVLTFSTDIDVVCPIASSGTLISIARCKIFAAECAFGVALLIEIIASCTVSNECCFTNNADASVRKHIPGGKHVSASWIPTLDLNAAMVNCWLRDSDVGDSQSQKLDMH